MNQKYGKHECYSDYINQDVDQEYSQQNESDECTCKKEEYNNYPQENEGINYPLTKEPVQYENTYEHTNCNQAYDYQPPTPFNNAWGLPLESARFQNIGAFNGSATVPHGDRVWAANFLPINTQMNNIQGCERTRVNWSVILYNRTLNYLDQFYILYQTDSGDFIIANLRTGRVVANNASPNAILTAEYTGVNQQIFRRQFINSNGFRLIPTSNLDRVINLCATRTDRNNILETSLLSGGSPVWRHFDTRPINLPARTPQTSLGPLPSLTGLNDSGPIPALAPRSVIGSALIPCVFVNDVIPIGQRMQQSPYYVLEYRQYWHRLWSDILIANQNRLTNEEFGVIPGEQDTLRDTINMTIGTDWGLQFGNLSQPFSLRISSNLNISRSNTNILLGRTTVVGNFRNPNNFTTRFSRFAIGNEFVLRRMDGTVVRTWGAVRGDSLYLKTFPTNTSLVLENQKIVSADNSYDLSVWKTPMTIKDGEVKIKNERNSKPNYE